MPCSVRVGEATTGGALRAPAASRRVERHRAIAGPLRVLPVTAARGGAVAEAGPRSTILSWRRLLICLGGGLLAAGLATVAGVPEIAVLVG
ncbi:MAG: hypothetical protein QOG20_6836 [Pseudonocardiales bacterium]|nr:hypothetical protein [Pseudonocardiales bacterium]